MAGFPENFLGTGVGISLQQIYFSLANFFLFGRIQHMIRRIFVIPSLVLLLCLGACQSTPQFHGQFVERSIAIPGIGFSTLKDAFRNRGWKVVASGMAIQTTYSNAESTTRPNPAARYTLLCRGAVDNFNSYTWQEGTAELSIIDNITSEEVCSYTCGPPFRCYSAAAFVEEVEKHTFPAASVQH